jgi:DNA repair exonuclease SbcCD ATPase subunit
LKDLKTRLSSLSGELRAMQTELERAALQKGAEFDSLDEDLLKEFKDSIDRLRHVIWPYVEAVAARTDDVDTTLQRYRMERVTDMLENLKNRVETPDLGEVPEVRSFFSNIQQIATSAVEKHLERIAQAGSRPSSPGFVVPKRLVN